MLYNTNILHVCVCAHVCMFAYMLALVWMGVGDVSMDVVYECMWVCLPVSGNML